MSDDSAKGGPAVDLLGDPWTPPRDPRGRKRHRRLPQIAEIVAVSTATGDSEEEIADLIGISVPTLRKYYFRELNPESKLPRQVLMAAMWKKALAGNVAAARFCAEQFTKGEQAAFEAKQNAPRPSAIGKKQAAAAAAATAGHGSDWGEDLVPSAVN